MRSKNLCIDTWAAHEEAVSCVKVEGIRVVTASFDKTVKLWDLRNRRNAAFIHELIY
jgi:WD40 repeat protein